MLNPPSCRINTKDITSDDVLKDKIRDFFNNCDYEDDSRPVAHFVFDPSITVDQKQAVSSKICTMANEMRENGEIDQVPMACTFTIDKDMGL